MRKTNAKSLINYFLLAFFIIFYCYTNSFYVNWGGGDSPIWVLSVLKSPIPEFYRTPSYQEHFFRRCSEYPLFTILGKLFNLIIPGSNTAYKINLMVAIFGGLAIFVIFLIIKKITYNTSSAIIGSLALLFSHHFWLEANLGEIYTLHFFIVTVIIYNLLKWHEVNKNKYLYIISLFLGLGITHHTLIFLIILPLFLFFLLRFKYLPKDYKVYILSVFIFLVPPLIFNSLTNFLVSADIGFLKKLYMFFQNILFSGTSWIFSNFSFKELMKYFIYLFYQFPFLGFILGFLGLFSFPGGMPLKLFLYSFCFLSVIFPVSFISGLGSIDRPTFYIGSYIIFSIFIGIGFYKICRSIILISSLRVIKNIYLLSTIMIVILPVLTYSLSPILVKRFNIKIGPKNYLKYRDFEWYFLFPPKRWDNGAHRFGIEAFELVEPNAFIYANYTPQYLLIYHQFINQNRWDVNIFNADILNAHDVKNIASQFYEWIYDFPIYIVPYRKPDKLEIDGLILKPIGPLYKLIPESKIKDESLSLESNKSHIQSYTYDSAEDEMILIPSVELSIDKLFTPEFIKYITNFAKEKIQLENMLRIFEDEFYIDKYEVSAKDFAEFLNIFKNDNERFMGEDRFANIIRINSTYYPRDNSRDLPANNVTAKGAEQYALWKHKRLPYEIEWERAATNNYSTNYPWGNLLIRPQLANYHKSWMDSEFRVYSSVYEFTLGDNNWGTRQLIGNVMEWTKKMNFNLISELQGNGKFIEACSNRIKFFSKGHILKGGSWYTYPENIDPRNSIDIPPHISHNAYAGFRCARDVQR